MLWQVTDMMMHFFVIFMHHTYAHTQIYNCVHTLTNTKPGMGYYCLLRVCLWSMNKKHL